MFTRHISRVKKQDLIINYEKKFGLDIWIVVFPEGLLSIIVCAAGKHTKKNLKKKEIKRKNVLQSIHLNTTHVH